MVLERGIEGHPCPRYPGPFADLHAVQQRVEQRSDFQAAAHADSRLGHGRENRESSLIRRNRGADEMTHRDGGGEVFQAEANTPSSPSPHGRKWERELASKDSRRLFREGVIKTPLLYSFS